METGLLVGALSLSKKISILNNSLNQTDYKNYLIKTYKINNLIFLYKLIILACINQIKLKAKYTDGV